ncbi:MAG: ABC transporter [Oscillospiraceae bacterium]|nr:ABC transporter [Oscillospiraceae bacterium]
MKAIFNREFNSYFNGVIGYVFSAVILIFAGIYTVATNLKGAMANFEYTIVQLCIILVIAVPILTMRSVAEERRQKTDILLYSLPLSSAKIVLGKYFAMLAVLAFPVIVLACYPLILASFGEVPFVTVYSTLFAFFLMGSTLVSMGLFVSSLTENQAFAAALCIAVLLINYFIANLADFVPAAASASFTAFVVVVLLLGIIMYLLTKNTQVSIIFTIICELTLTGAYMIWQAKFYGLFSAVISRLSVFDRFYSFVTGVFDLTSVLYYISVIFIFLFLTVQSLEKRRWS